MRIFTLIRAAAVAPLLVAVVAAGPTPTAKDQKTGVPFGQPTELVAILTDPINIDLKWRDNASNEAGYFVEYSPDANNEYFIIEALPPNSTTYRHPNLLPETRFVFRIRPFFGEPSNVAEITTGKEGPQQDITEKEEKAAANLAPVSKSSLKSAEGFLAAAPIKLSAKLIPPAGVHLQWVDRAKDADGYLVEIKGEGPDFRASAFLTAGSSSLVTYNFPFESTFAFRVRAFVYGQPSNLAEQTTGEDPTMPRSVATSSAAAATAKP